MAMLRRGICLKCRCLKVVNNSASYSKEFAICFKGSRQLDWSRGLKAMFSIDNKTDEELAEETEKTSVDFDTVERQFFDLLRRYQCRAYYLELCNWTIKTVAIGVTN